MKQGGGRRKGNSFEREVSKIIVDAFASFGVTKADCFRTPSSGGHKFAKKDDPGDLVMSAKLLNLFPFKVVECKHQKNVNLGHFFYLRDTMLEAQWWKQTLDQAKEHWGLLVFKADGRVFCCYKALHNSDPDEITLTNPKAAMIVKYNGDYLHIRLFDDLLGRIVESRERKRKKQ